MKKDNLKKKLKFVYGTHSEKLFIEIQKIVSEYSTKFKNKKKGKLEENDIFLIAYPDHISEENHSNLKTLSKFCDLHLSECITGIHILPHYPYSSDDGFSVIDFRKVNEKFGNWEDISEFNFQIMIDVVLNHISSKSIWFKKALEGDSYYKDFFIWQNDCPELELVDRARTTPLLTEFKTSMGNETVWTTYSDDQIDLNYENPELFLEILRIFCFYLLKGASSFRLDAVAYLWKEIGTSCIHHEKTHEIIKIFREVLTEINPSLLLLSETNVPHSENMSYFGNGYDEAHMAYQFSLPPLLVYSIHKENSLKLTKWAESIKILSEECTSFNLTATHDGIGLKPLFGIIEDNEIKEMVDKVNELNGGQSMCYTKKDGSKFPYEMNATFFDAIDVKNTNESEEIKIARMVAVQTISMTFQGVAAFYLSSLFGFHNDINLYNKTGISRSINREKFTYEYLESIIKGNSIHGKIFSENCRLIKIRKNESAFNPWAKQIILNISDKVFAMIRHNEKTNDKILVIVNITPHFQEVNISGFINEKCIDLVTDKECSSDLIRLDYYQILMLKKIR